MTTFGCTSPPTEAAFAQPLRSLVADERRGRGQISRWRFPRDASRRFCALLGHRRADPARGAQILERRFAGGLCLARGGIAAAGREVAISAFLPTPACATRRFHPPPASPAAPACSRRRPPAPAHRPCGHGPFRL